MPQVFLRLERGIGELLARDYHASYRRPVQQRSMPSSFRAAHMRLQLADQSEGLYVDRYMQSGLGSVET
jgi:hypothetical protein